jgi:hypothetical protein
MKVYLYFEQEEGDDDDDLYVFPIRDTMEDDIIQGSQSHGTSHIPG